MTPELTQSIVNVAYLIASALFIFGIKGLTHPRTAVRGNMLGAAGMALAVIATMVKVGVPSPWVIAGLLVGTVIGVLLAQKVEMTAMPELVALFNGFGGAASFLVAGLAMVLANVDNVAEIEEAFGVALSMTGGHGLQAAIATMLSGLIGSVTFTGSLIALGKLQGWKWIPDGFLFPGHNLSNLVMLLACVGLGYYGVANPSAIWTYFAIVVISCALGMMLVFPIGGADMPVVIALLNSYSGLAAAATGFVIDNNVLIISGSLVGSSGLILTAIMCKAMNRSLANVLFGGLLSDQGGGGPKADVDEIYKTVKSTSPEEVAMIMETSQRVVIVPGYGMAVAQAQHAVRELANVLESRGATVEYAIHPVAGRMPGHMNVLLAEADVPYDKLIEMDNINPTMNTVDVALVIGANDVVNPDARKADSPIAGMPIIDVDEARTVIVVKRSLSPGFAGIPNPLFALPNAQMMFGDGKQAIIELTNSLKES